jgi:hypothetical protein
MYRGKHPEYLIWIVFGRLGRGAAWCGDSPIVSGPFGRPTRLGLPHDYMWEKARETNRT